LSTIPPISTKQQQPLPTQIIEHKKDDNYGVGILGHGFGQAQQSGLIKPFNWIPTLSL
jgi:hypothetical protein